MLNIASLPTLLAQLVLRTQASCKEFPQAVRPDQRKCLRTASVRQDHRKYCVLVLRTHPVGAVV